MKTFKVDIFTPFGHYYSDDVAFLEVRSEEYTLGILPDHSPLISTVKICKMIIEKNEERMIYAISGGVIRVENNQVTLLVNAIESEDEIDLLRAEQAKERAENRLKKLTNEEPLDITRAQLALERAINRINIKKRIDQ